MVAAESALNRPYSRRRAPELIPQTHSQPQPNSTMAQYVDGYVLPLPKRNIKAYQRMASLAGKVWRDHGALDYHECVGEDLNTKMASTFPRGLKTKPGETIVFAWVVFKSRAHRDRVNAKVMKDPRLSEMMDPGAMPFDAKRMLYGGFKTIV
jgi:uncharacterized protein YbaA (DUF1428 family)